MSAVVELRMADVQALRLRATGVETLRALAGPGARALGHDRTAEYAFLAVEAAGVIREFVYLPNQKALIEYDIAGQVTWTWTSKSSRWRPTTESL